MSLFLRRRVNLVSAGFVPITAVGGDDVFDEEIAGVLFRIHVFTTVGSSQAFEVLDLGNSDGSVEYLAVAGGGSGADRVPGGGGAGELLISDFVTETQSYPINVGAGAPSRNSGVNNPGFKGGSTSLFGLTLNGGGEGENQNTGGSGGSGGGTARDSNTGGASVKTAGGLGNAGGNATRNFNGSGGGGAGGAGMPRTTNSTTGRGNGGPGFQTNFDGTLRFYAGGGGGGVFNTQGDSNAPVGLGGSGVGGNGGRGANGQAGVANTGSGGGGGGGTGRSGGAGGSGIVIVRYPLQPV